MSVASPAADAHARLRQQALRAEVYARSASAPGVQLTPAQVRAVHMAAPGSAVRSPTDGWRPGSQGPWVGVGSWSWWQRQYGPNPSRDETGCPNDGGAYVDLPDFHDTLWETQLCFAAEYMQVAWPDTGCCRPELNRREGCEPPAFRNVLHTLLPEHVIDNAAGDDARADDRSALTPWAARAMVASSVQLPLDHLDIVQWVACLVESWSPEMEGFALADKLVELLTPGLDGQLPWTISYSDASHADPGATAWAFVRRYELFDEECGHPAADGSVGVILPMVDRLELQDRLDRWMEGGDSAFCAVVQEASEIVHELVHVLADCYAEGRPPLWHAGRPGALHDNEVPTCWDEGRMVGTLFVWAMTQRFPCLAKGHSPSSDGIQHCACMADPRLAAYSTGTYDQLECP